MTIKIKRDGSNWSNKKFKVEQITDMLEGLNWMNAHKYTAYRAYTNRNGNRVVDLRKKNCNTEYSIEFVG